jgi:hypothetical protein
MEERTRGPNDASLAVDEDLEKDGPLDLLDEGVVGIDRLGDPDGPRGTVEVALDQGGVAGAAEDAATSAPGRPSDHSVVVASVQALGHACLAARLAARELGVGRSHVGGRLLRRACLGGGHELMRLDLHRHGSHGPGRWCPGGEGKPLRERRRRGRGRIVEFGAQGPTMLCGHNSGRPERDQHERHEQDDVTEHGQRQR